MKILQLCHKPPLPAVDGGCIAMNNITQGLLKSGHKVKILTIYTFKHDFMPERMSKEYLDATNIEGVYVDTRLNAIDAFSSFITADSYNVNRFFSTDFDIKLSRILKNETFDIIHIESLFMTPYLGTIRRYSKASVFLRAHNLEFVIWEKIAKGTRNIFKKIYLIYLSKKLRSYEVKTLNEVAGIAAISEEDRKRFISLGIQCPIETIPFGIDYANYAHRRNTEPEMALFHLGSMDWSPNLEGIQWFLSEVWPKVRIQRPHLKLYLAGRSMPEEQFADKYENVEVVGEVDDAKGFMSSKAIMIVPLLSAGGVRVKIIEGLALGKVIISTSIGAEGSDCTDNKDILIADTPGEWVKAIDRLFDEKDLLHRLSTNAMIHAQKFDNDSIIQRLLSFYKKNRKQ